MHYSKPIAILLLLAMLLPLCISAGAAGEEGLTFTANDAYTGIKSLSDTPVTFEA